MNKDIISGLDDNFISLDDLTNVIGGTADAPDFKDILRKDQDFYFEHGTISNQDRKNHIAAWEDDCRNNGLSEKHIETQKKLYWQIVSHRYYSIQSRPVK